MKNQFAIGDILITKKLGFIDHKGVYLGSNAILTNTPKKGEHVTTVKEFSEGHLIGVEPTNANPTYVALNAQKILSNPKGYHLFFRNCEHTVYEVIKGIAKSPAVAALGIAALVGILCLLFRR